MTKARTADYVSTHHRRHTLRLVRHAEFIAKENSKDPSTKVGAVITDQDYRGVSWGYNGFPRKIADTPERLHDRDVKYRYTIHADMNAVLFAGRPLTNCRMFLWPMLSCERCAPHIIQVGITEVVAPEKLSSRLVSRWGAGVEEAIEMYKEAQVQVALVNLEKGTLRIL